MASRSIAIKITIDNRDAINAAQAQVVAMKGLQQQTEANTQLQESLTNSFLKGNIAARAISMGFETLKSSVGFVVKGLSDLEMTMAKVQVTTGANVVDTERLTDSIFKLGRETSSSVKDISKASLELAKLGLSGKDLEIVLDGVSRLSSVLGDSLESTGQLVGGVVNTFDLSSKQVASVADKLFVATGKSAASIDSFRVAFGLAGNVAANAGVSFEELAAVIATLSNQGIKASTIGTGLRTWITDLSIEGSKAQKVLGGSFESMGLLGSMEKMAQIHPDTGTIFDMFGKPGSAVATAMERSTGMYKEFLDAVQNGSGTLQANGAIINETLIGSVTRLNNTFLELFSTLTKGFAGTGELNFFSKIAEQLGSANDEALAQERFGEFIKRHVEDAHNAQEGMQLAARDLGFKEGDRFSDDELKNAFLKKEQTDKVKIDAALLVAQKLQQDEERNRGEGPTYVTPVTHRNLKAEADKLAKSMAKIAREAEEKQRNAMMKLVDKREGKEGPVTPEMNDFLVDPLSYGMSKAEGKGKAKTEDITKEIQNVWAKYNTDAQKAQRLTEQFATAFIGMKAGIDSVNSSSQILSSYFVEGIFSSKKDPFKHISDAFGDFAKKMAADLVALSLKIMFFKALMAGLGSFGGGGAMPFVGALAKATTGFSGFASGTDQVVTKPTMFMAGEAGKERVTVTPRAKVGAGGNGSGITVVIQGDVMDGQKFTDAVELAQKKLSRRNV